MAKANQPGITKRILINKANTQIVAVTSAAAFLSVFSLVASKTLFSQASYQNRVINAQQKAENQIKADQNATNNLASSYNAFIDQPQNVLGGNPLSTTNSNDGSNAKIVLDALPSSYDFSALVASLTDMLNSQHVTIDGITASDESTQQDANQSSTQPKPIAIPFEVTVDGNYQEIQNVINELENSIRPIQIQTLSISGGSGDLVLTITAETYYQPAKNLTTTTEIIK